MKDKIEHKWLYKQSSEEIWEFLTKAELIEKWLMPNTFEPIIGHEFQFNTNPIPDLGLSGIFYCKVLALKPFEKLVYSWKGGTSVNEITLDSIVEWTLASKENGTELSLLHTGFKKENFSILTAMFEGWNRHITTMVKHLNEVNNDSTKA